MCMFHLQHTTLLLAVDKVNKVQPYTVMCVIHLIDCLENSAMEHCSPEAVHFKAPRLRLYPVPLTAREDTHTLWGIFIFPRKRIVANEPRRHNSLRWHCPAGASGKLSSSGALYHCESEYIRWLG